MCGACFNWEEYKYSNLKGMRYIPPFSTRVFSVSDGIPMFGYAKEDARNLTFTGEIEADQYMIQYCPVCGRKL